MALVKMVRDFPEVEGGNTVAMIPEEAINLAMDNGWRLEETKQTTKQEAKATAEEKTEEKVEGATAEEVKTEKAETKTKTHKRD